MKISAVIIAKNEEKNIASCIKSLNFCDEVVVIDDYSKDATVKIANERGARVFQRKLNTDYAAQRNFGLQKAKGDWVFFIDADERVSSELAIETETIVKQDKYYGAYLKRDDYIWSKKLKFGETANVRLLRLGKKGKGDWVRRVHEYWNLGGKIGEMKNHLEHYPHPDLRQYIESINRYSTLHAKAKFEGGEKSSLFKVIIFPLGKLLHNWIIKLGFLDGSRGLVVALVMSLHSFLAWSKLWLFQQKN